MSSTTRAQRLAQLRTRYELLARSASAIPLLEGTGEAWRAVHEGRLSVLTMTSDALTRIPKTLSADEILVALKVIRDQLATVWQADLARIAQPARAVEPALKDVWRARGSVPTLAAALQDVESLLPRKWRTQSGAKRASLLSLAKIRWKEEPDACVYCHLPAFTQLPDERGGLVLCQEHLAPFVTPAALRAVLDGLETRLASRLDLYCAVPLSSAVVEQDVAELQSYYTLRWLLAAQRVEDALAYRAHRDVRREEEAGLQISVNAASKPMQEEAKLSLEVPSTLRHRLVLLDLLAALKQADWIEEAEPGSENIVAA